MRWEGSQMAGSLLNVAWIDADLSWELPGTGEISWGWNWLKWAPFARPAGR